MDIRFIDYTKNCGIEPNEKNYRCWQHGYGCGAFKFKIDLLNWCNERKKIDSKATFICIDIWDQIIKKLKGR